MAFPQNELNEATTKGARGEYVTGVRDIAFPIRLTLKVAYFVWRCALRHQPRHW